MWGERVYVVTMSFMCCIRAVLFYFMSKFVNMWGDNGLLDVLVIWW